jgi:hypothetical protein
VLLAYDAMFSPSTVRPSDIPTHPLVTLALAAYTNSERCAGSERYVQRDTSIAAVASVTRSFAAVRSTHAAYLENLAGGPSMGKAHAVRAQQVSIVYLNNASTYPVAC